VQPDWCLPTFRRGEWSKSKPSENPVRCMHLFAARVLLLAFPAYNSAWRWRQYFCRIAWHRVPEDSWEQIKFAECLLLFSSGLQSKTVKSCILWDIILCSPLKDNRRVGGTSRLHLQGARISQAGNEQKQASHLQSREAAHHSYRRDDPKLKRKWRLPCA
jgi:hypothetical protein